MKKSIIRYSFSALASLLFASAPLFALDGSGTAYEPYVIADVDDWNTFASNISSGINADAYYMLSETFENASSPVSVMAGTKDKPFKGSFDGNGRTLTVDISVSEYYAGPFRFVNGALIRNLTVTGSITSNNAKFAGGFIGGTTGGTAFIENCICSVTVTGTIGGDGTHGGFIGISEGSSSVEFLDCLFCGKLLGSTCNSCGGFLGYRNGPVSYTNCLFSPEEITMSVSLSAVFNRNGGASITNCYYTRNFGEKQGIKALKMSEAELLELLGEGWELKDGKLMPICGSNVISVGDMTGLESMYAYNGSEIILNYKVIHYGKELVRGTDYTAKIIDSEGNPVNLLISKGHNTLVITGIGDYCGVKKFPLIVRFGGKGTVTEPFMLENTVDWNDFAGLLNSSDGSSYKNANCILSADIDFGGIAGAFKRVYSFAGIFDGKSHTVSGINGYAKGLFEKLEAGGVIKNVTLKNSVLPERGYCGGIAGINYGNITACHVTDDVYIYSTDSPQDNEWEHLDYFCHGGISGDNHGVIEGCSSGATVIQRTGNNHYFGGIAGINRSGGILRNCFYYGSRVYAEGEYAAICGYNYGSASLCLTICPELTAINGNTSGAFKAYSLIIKTDELFLNSALSENYGKITVFPGCILFNKTLYAPEGQNLSLDFIFKNEQYDKTNIVCDYKYINGSQTEIKTCIKNSDGTHSFRMPSADVEFYAGYEWEGAGTDEEPYLIENSSQMDFFAVRVNYEGNSYSGKYFALKNDIEWNSQENNYTPVGGYYEGELKNFCGIFDGKNYFLSGIKISKDVTGETGKYTGLFGRIGAGGQVKNLILKNSSIKGYFSAGGIAGYNEGDVLNCSVEESVSVFSELQGSACHGGIAGYNAGTLSACTSSALVLNSTSAGGITGYCKKGELSLCAYYESENTKVKASDSFYGYIAGHFTGGILNKNFYIGKALYALGGVSLGYDADGAERAYSVYSKKYTFVSEEGSQAFEYNSSLYALKGSLVKLKLESFEPDPDTVTGLCSADDINKAFVFESYEDGIYTFTMPDYDVLVAELVKVEFKAEAGTPFNERLVVKGEKLTPFNAPFVSGKVFEAWYTDSEFTKEFDFSLSVNKNLTLYAKYSSGFNLEAKEDPFCSGVFYTTFYSSKLSYKVDSNSKVFYVTKKSDGKLCIEEEPSGIINAGNGVIIKSNTPFVSLLVTSLKGTYLYGNILTGTDSEITAKKGTYIMGFSKKGGIGFYKWNGTVFANKAFVLSVEGADE